jgi:hypothetical protein
MIFHNDNDLAHAAWDMIKKGCAEQDLLTKAEDMANRGEADDADQLQCVVERMARLRSDPNKRPCQICGYGAEVTADIDDGIEQHCPGCGSFQVERRLLDDWRSQPEDYQVLRREMLSYISHCNLRGLTPKLDAATLDHLRRMR